MATEALQNDMAQGNPKSDTPLKDKELMNTKLLRKGFSGAVLPLQCFAEIMRDSQSDNDPGGLEPWKVGEVLMVLLEKFDQAMGEAVGAAIIAEQEEARHE